MIAKRRGYDWEQVENDLVTAAEQVVANGLLGHTFMRWGQGGVLNHAQKLGSPVAKILTLSPHHLDHFSIFLSSRVGLAH